MAGMTAREILARDLERIGPPPGNDPVERLRHVVRVFADVPPASIVVTATSCVYPDEKWTGLTHDDLRALLELIEDQAERDARASDRMSNDPRF